MPVPAADAEPESEAELDPGVDTEPEVVPGAEAAPGSGGVPGAEAVPEFETDAEPDSEAELEPGAAQEPEVVPGAEAGPVSEGAPTTEAVPEADAEPEYEPEFEREVVPGAEAVLGGDAVPESEASTESEPEPESEAEPEAVPGTEGGPAVGAQGERAADGVFKVRLANFEGPFDLLLQLISKHKLDVTEVALSKVTDEFMAYIRAMGPDWDLDETTEFLVVAATLLDLKAARLLPAAQVEDEADLALLEARDLLFARLLQYRAYKQIADIFNRRLDEEARRYPRTVGLEPHHADLLPEVVISIGPEGFAKLAVKAMQPKPKPQVYVDHIHAPLVSVQEQAGIVVARLRELGEASFRLLVEDADGTLTVVARFLALLELYREKAVALDQETALGELVVRWTGGAGEAEPMVTDEFDRPPEPPKPEPPKEDKA
ncbi:segregation and condensation protein A [Streptomyces sp. SLBN-8D4]